MRRKTLSRKSKSTIPKLRRKCDALLQQEGRRRFKKCEVCDKLMNCLHHFYPKSMSSKLRYEWTNLIPICNSCHFRHHSTGDPSIHATIISKRGQEWYEFLTMTKREIIKTSVAYYREVLQKLQSKN